MQETISASQREIPESQVPLRGTFGHMAGVCVNATRVAMIQPHQRAWQRIVASEIVALTQ